MKKLILILLASMLLIGSAQAWTLVGSEHSGSIQFFDGGRGVADISGYPQEWFSWDQINQNNFEAHYLIWTVPFIYNPENDTITSTQYPGLKLVR